MSKMFVLYYVVKRSCVQSLTWSSSGATCGTGTAYLPVCFCLLIVFSMTFELSFCIYYYVIPRYAVMITCLFICNLFKKPNKPTIHIYFVDFIIFIEYLLLIN